MSAPRSWIPAKPVQWNPNHRRLQGCALMPAGLGEWKGFYERGCQVKTLLLLQEGLVFVGIQPPADELDDFECKGSAVVFPFASVRVESSSELRQAWGRD